MGGIIGLTVRFSKDREYRGSCWTNVLPEGLFAAPFYIDLDTSRKHVEVWLKNILANREENPDVDEAWGEHRLLAPVEYGLVVVDYVTSTLVSCQGFSNPAMFNYWGSDDDEKWSALEKAGLLLSIRRGHRPGLKKAGIKLPFQHTIFGMEDGCNGALEGWCEENFGLSDAERAAWSEWYKRFEE